MKKFFNSTMYASLFMIALIFTACQTDKDDILQLDDQAAITNTSATAKLIERVGSLDGSFDDIVDRSSCFALNFPYTVNVNGLEITINSLEDLRLIKEIFDSVDGDADILDIIFPITITKADFTEMTINSIEELRKLAADCIKDDDIKCIDFVYPINILTFNTNEEQTGTVTVNSDKELIRFFAGLDENDLVSIDFPIVLKNVDGVVVTVNNNTALRAAIERAINTCNADNGDGDDGDDEGDGNGDDGNGDDGDGGDGDGDDGDGNGDDGDGDGNDGDGNGDDGDGNDGDGNGDDGDGNDGDGNGDDGNGDGDDEGDGNGDDGDGNDGDGDGNGDDGDGNDGDGNGDDGNGDE